jgi:hypothetical protein
MDRGQDGGAVVLGLFQQVVMADHLQVKQAAEQQHKTHQHHQLDGQHPRLKAVDFSLRVAQFGE